jgi:hypothetical protein
MKHHPYLNHSFSINKRGELLTFHKDKENIVFGFKIIIVRSIKYVVPVTNWILRKNS